MLLLTLISMSDLTVFASPYDVHSSIRGGWSKNYGTNNHEMESGLRLAYDIYNNKYLDNGFRITTRDFGKGNLQYLNVTGWAVLFGYKRHTATNHQTYIVAKKVAGKNNIGSTKIYRAGAFGNLSATEDLEYNNQGPGSVWRECPATATKKNNLTCNMRYDNVGFSSYLPLKELFPDAYEQAEWALFLVKKVDNWIVYTQLKTPFSFSDKGWNKGKLRLRSGGQANLMKTEDYPVIRRGYPRQPANVIGPKYFTVNRLYEMIDQEETQTTVWFGLRTPEDGNAKKWANSVYFGTAGTQARLSYTPDEKILPPPTKPEKPDGMCKAPVTPKDRYAYEFDFEAREIDGRTAEKNTMTQTKVTFFRKSYATQRNAAKADIQDDIQYRKSLRTSQQSKLAQEKATYSSLSKQYDEAMKDEDYDKADQISGQMEPVLQRIANLECSINSLNVEISHYQNEYDKLVEKETKLEKVTTSYTVKFNEQVIAFKTISLYEDEFSYATINWNLPSNGDLKGDINSNRYSYEGVTEETYDNNVIETPIYIATEETVGMCSPLGETSELSGVVRTVNNSQTGEISYGETVTTSLSIPIEHQVRRAGYGFDYTITSVYTNDDPESNATGAKAVRSYFPVLSTYLEYPKRNISFGTEDGELSLSGHEANLKAVNATTFKLPNVYLEKFSGHVFESPVSTHPNRNLSDTLIDGGTKFYVPFDYPNGDMKFDSIALDAGVNKMKTCVTGEIAVEGTPVDDPSSQDDFYQRPLSPDEPFLNGVGWNMQSNQSVINSMKTWYNNWSADPFNPSASYKETYYLTPETIEKIQNMTNSNMNLKKGDSLFNKVNIPRKK